MKYLVTGGFGFIGSHLVENLVNMGHEISVVDNFSNGHLTNLSHINDKITTYISNVENLYSINFISEIDGIFHLATAPRSSSLKDPMRDIETNCKGMIAILELAKKYDAKVVFTSNSGIYGAISLTDNNSSINETWANNPTTPYDVNKLASEYYCKIYYNLYGVKSTILRLATVYGERQRVNEKLNWRPLVATVVKNIINNEEVIINGDGNQTRDLIYVQDVVQALIKAMQSSVNNAEIFLISTNTETSVNEVVRIVEDITSLKARIRHSEPLPADIRRVRYDYSNAKKYLNFEPRFTIREGIKRVVEYTSKLKEKVR